MAVQAPTQTRLLGNDFVEAAERALSSGQLEQVSDAELERIMTTDTPPGQPVTPASVTPTDIVVTASDLIKSVGLNLWDVSMWFNRTKS